MEESTRRRLERIQREVESLPPPIDKLDESKTIYCATCNRNCDRCGAYRWAFGLD